MQRLAVVLPFVVSTTAPFSAVACSKIDPEPTAAPPSSAASSASSASSASAAPPLIIPTDASGYVPLPPVTIHSGPLQREDGGHLKPTTPPPKDDPALAPPAPKREPDFDLDLDDPSRDYVSRYVRATKRYGDKTACVSFGKSYEKAGRRAVDVRDDPKSSCGGTSDALRDTFLVDVGADRMKLDDPKGRPPLAKWPDGSEPDAKPGPALSIDDFKKFASPVVDEINKQKLTVIRVQLYGRGTYPLFTLAGWRDPIAANVAPDDVKPLMAKLCAANDNKPFSFVAGINRSTTLRVRCPSGDARWDKF